MITSTLFVKRLSKNNPQNHIQYDHQEFYCDNCDKYILHNCQIWKKHVLNVKSVKWTSKLQLNKKKKT